MKEIDVGFTHVAFVVRDLEKVLISTAVMLVWKSYIGESLIFRRHVKSRG